MNPSIEQVTTTEGCDMCREVATAIWGSAAACSSAQMMVHATTGGVVLLALDGPKPIGFLFSFPARYAGEWVLWSHETGVLEEYLHLGIGTKLKRRQRLIARDLGYERIAWTFDPLISRNAHFNLNKLGAEIVEYKVNVYGTDKTDLVNRGMETDRFIAVWSTDTDVVGKLPPEQGPIDIPSAPGEPDAQLVVRVGPSGAPQVVTPGNRSMNESLSVEIPIDFGALLANRREVAVEWRMQFRAIAQSLMADGYVPSHFGVAEDKGIYTWRRGGR